jgi:hypothetical protein
MTRLKVASLLGFLGGKEEAERELRDILSRYLRTLGEEHPETLRCRSALAAVLAERGKLADAEKEIRECLRITEKACGKEHPDTLGHRNDLATLLAGQGRIAEAAGEHRVLLVARQRLLGVEHPDTLQSRYNLANALHGMRDFAGAERELRALIPMMVRVFGAEYPITLRARFNLAMALGAAGKYADAGQELRDLLPVMEKVFGPSHPETVDCRKKTLQAQRPGNGGGASIPSRTRGMKAMPMPVQPAPAGTSGGAPPDFRESFQYAARQPIAGMNGGTGWAGPWSGIGATVEVASLVTADFPAHGGSLLIPATGHEVIISRPLGPLEKFADPAQGGTWFFTCLLQHGGDLPVPGGDIQINPLNASNVHDLVRIVASDMGGALQFTLNSAADPIEVHDASKPVLVVMRVTLRNPQDGGWDLDAELYVNPEPGAQLSPDARKVSVTLNHARIPTELGLLIRKPRSEATTRIDEIRFLRRFGDIFLQPPAVPAKK